VSGRLDDGDKNYGAILGSKSPPEARFHPALSVFLSVSIFVYGMCKTVEIRLKVFYALLQCLGDLTTVIKIMVPSWDQKSPPEACFHPALSVFLSVRYTFV